MINSLEKSAKRLAKEWPEVFEDCEITAIPVMYIDTVHIEFVTGMAWEVDVKNYLNSMDVESIHDSLQEMFSEYEDEIKNVDYTFDVPRLKKDAHIISHRLI